MSWLIGDPSTRIRYATDLLPAVVAASGQAASRFVATNDDDKPRRLTGIFSTFTTKNLRIHLRVAGKEYAVIDTNSFNNAKGFLEQDQVYGVNQQLEYALESPAGSAAAVAANTDEIVFRFEAAPSTG